MTNLKTKLENIGVNVDGLNLRKKPKKYMQPFAIERSYEKFLRSVLRELKQNVVNLLIPILPDMVQELKEDEKRTQLDGYVEDLTTAMNILDMQNGRAVKSLNFEQVANKIGADINEFSQKEHTKVLKSVLGVSPFSSEPWLNNKQAEFTRRNVNLIKKLQSETLTDINQIVTNGIRSGLRHEEIKRQIIRQIGLDTLESSGFKMSGAKRAKLIARDQATKFYGELTKARQKNVGIDTYYWRTAGDSNVRGDDNGAPRGDYHDVLNGKLMRWDDPTSYSDDNGKTWNKRSSIGGYIGDPGSDYNCRCIGEPNFSDVI